MQLLIQSLLIHHGKDNGYVAWNLWGGKSGVNWAIKKMESIRNND